MQPQASSDDSGSGQRCAACGGLFDPLSRKATQIAMGPWYIRDKSNPFRPGCCFEVLKRQIEAGKIKPTTVLRGPTTRQFWAIARNVPGVSHLLGYCPRCGVKVKPTDVACTECAEPFIEPDERNELGLAYTTKTSAESAFRQLEKEVEGAPATKHAGSDSKPRSTRKPTAHAAAAAAEKSKPKGEDWMPGLDLLDEVIGPATDEPKGKPSPGRSRLAAMRESEEATATPSKRHATVRLGSAIDFAPSDDAEDGGSHNTAIAGALTGMAPGTAGAAMAPTYINPNRGMNVVVWMLVAVNLLLLPILVGALLYFLGVFKTEPQVTQPSAGTSVFDDGFTLPDVPAQATLPPEPISPPAPSQEVLVAPEPAPVPAPQPATPPVVAPPAVSPALADAVRSAVEEAQRLETAGEYTRAITLLKDVKQKTRPSERPADLDARINRIQEKIDRAESADFFTIPLNEP